MGYDVVVLGGGAAGLFSAIFAARRGRRVLVVEHAEKLGKKILISGGGRCNFTNKKVTANNFVSKNPHFVRSALSRFAPEDFIAMVEAHGIAYHEKTLGQLFCDHSSRQIVDMLVNECQQAGAHLWTGVRVTSVEKRERFLVQTSRGELDPESVIVATGGLSIPKMGATGFGYDVARRFGLDIVPPEPALVPLTETSTAHLSGVSFPARVSVGKHSFDEAVLLTHTGLSGPAILQVSSYWQPGEVVTVDASPGQRIALEVAKRAGAKEHLKNALSHVLPKRLAEHMAGGLGEKSLADMKDAELAAVAERIHAWRLTPTATAGFDKAEVTRGGVSTHALAQKTMAANAVPGLYFVGEVVDVTGWLGGYNFQWAWASGHSAGQHA